MGEPGDTEAPNPGDDQGRGKYVLAVLQLFTDGEALYGAEFTQRVFAAAGSKRMRQAARALRLRVHVEELLGKGRSKQDIIIGMTAPLPPAARQARARALRSLYGLTSDDPKTVRTHIDRLLAEDLPFDIFGR